MQVDGADDADDRRALAERRGARPAAGPAYLAERDGGWVEVSQAEAARRVDDIANGLLALGVRKGDAFAILGSTSLEWCLFDFALGLIGAIGAPVYANSSARDCEYVIGHSESVGVLVEDAEQLAKVEAVARACPGSATCSRSRTCPSSRRAAASTPPSIPSALDDASAEVGEDDLFTYIYTSGTTGPPKACMIRHRNYFEMAACVDRLPTGSSSPTDTLLLYLPLAHNYGRLIHLQARLRRLHARLLPRPAPGRRRARRRPADRLPERAPRLREGPRALLASWTRRPGRSARSDSGRSASAGRSACCGRRASRSRGCSRSSTGSPTASSTRR